MSCNAKSGVPFNVWFIPAQISNGISLGVPRAYPESATREHCETEIKKQIANPSTLKIHSILGYATEIHNNGNRTVIQEFSAKNSFDVETRFTGNCLVLPSGRVDLSTTDYRR